jgi:hypothetical protein
VLAWAKIGNVPEIEQILSKIKIGSISRLHHGPI